MSLLMSFSRWGEKNVMVAAGILIDAPLFGIYAGCKMNDAMWEPPVA
jgi:hypothetical protein